MINLDCQNCRLHHFCCTFKVKLTWLDIIRIWLRGHQYFWERNFEDAKTIKHRRQYCHFLKGRRCQIYSIRPKSCRQFPFLYPEISSCRELLPPYRKPL